jgi:pimeloyl-ACP methyl ester carboxylesterase
MWREQASLEKLARIVRFNLPGFGGAPPLGAESSASLAMYADHGIEAMDSAGVARACLCGLSMGGYILFEIWRRHRDRVASLVLCDTRAEPDTPEARDGRNEAIALARAGRVREVTRPMVPRLLAAASQPRLNAFVEEMGDAASAAGVADAQAAMRDRPDSRPLLGTIDVPVLIVVGLEDVLTAPDAARAMKEQIAGSRLVEIPSAGHVSPLERPEEFNAAVAAFLGRGPASAGR